VSTTLVHYGQPHKRAFPTGVDIWLPEGAVVIDVFERRTGIVITYLVPSGRTSRTG
jgi:hypothetical protein